MKILSTFLFALSLLYSAYAQNDEAQNDEASETLQEKLQDLGKKLAKDAETAENLEEELPGLGKKLAQNAETIRAMEKRLFGVNPMARYENENGGLYISLDFTPRQLGDGPVNEFGIDEGGEGTRVGTVPINNRGVFGDMSASLGFQHALSDSVSVRMEGGYRWMRFDLDNPTYSHIEMAPIPIDQINQLVQLNGDVEFRGPRGGAFLDFGLGDSGHFFYLGSSFGLVNVAGQYEATIGPDISILLDDSNTTTLQTYEAGAVFRFGRMGVRMGYELTRISAFNLTTMTGGVLSATPGDRHMVKIGLFHFFRKR